MPRHEFLCEKCQKPFELTMSTGRGELRRRGHVESFRATEIPDNEKPSD